MSIVETSYGQLSKNVKYYAVFQLIFVILVIILSSIGAFFHFLLDHEISIVESWLHNNHWEILIVSKLASLFLLNRWFTVRLYQLKSFRELVQELVSWPDPKAIVISVFMVMSYITMGRTNYVGQNIGYWYFQIASFLGLFVFFGIEFIVIAYLEDILNHKVHPPRFYLGLCYTIIFAAAFRMSVPDYYGLMPYVVLCYSSLIYLSGKSFKSWSNVVCFLLLFVAPMGSLFGLDPVWGDDFSPFRVDKKLNMAFLAVIWVISFSYYKYRDQFIGSARKLLR
ncbi:MAG: hypothetical protein H0V66_05110 [Bdellovibrionales bacterium]|nr:hypothetical protein [Bdellovibrionales bacterium]